MALEKKPEANNVIVWFVPLFNDVGYPAWTVSPPTKEVITKPVQLAESLFAKINVVASNISEVSIYSKDSLKIGKNILSFSDLEKQGYNVRIEKPSLVMSSSSVKVNEISVQTLGAPVNLDEGLNAAQCPVGV